MARKVNHVHWGGKVRLLYNNCNAKNNGVIFTMFWRKEGMIQEHGTQLRCCLERQWVHFLKYDRIHGVQHL